MYPNTLIDYHKFQEVLSQVKKYVKLQKDPYRVGTEFWQVMIYGNKEMMDPVRLQLISLLISEFNRLSETDFWSIIARDEENRVLMPIKAHITFLEDMKRKS